MVTLSCLIVIAALFSQLGSTVPSTSSVKAIDIFYFYFMLRLLMIFVHHTIYLLLTRYVESQNKKRQLENNAVHVIPSQHLNQKDPDPFDNMIEDVPEAAVYLSPKKRLPVTPWLSPSPLGAAAGSPISRLHQLDQRESLNAKNVTPMRPYHCIFNVCSIWMGYLLDIILITLYVGWIKNSRDDIIARYEECNQK